MPILSFSDNYLSTLYVGSASPKFTALGVADSTGCQYIAAFLMALREINDKSDGVEDLLLPHTHIKLAFVSPNRNFVAASNLALYLANSAFKGTGITGAIGAGSNAGSEGLGKVFSNTNFKITQVSFGASASDFGHKLIYPYFTRTNPSDSFQGKVLARLIYSKFGFTRVSLISSGDVFGADMSMRFQDEALQLGINIESSQIFSSGIKDFSLVINNILQDNGLNKVFVLLMSSADASLLLIQGYHLGLFHLGTQIFGCETVTNAATWNSMSSNVLIAKLMKGYIGILPTLNRNINSFQSFVKRWRAQPPSVITNPDGTKTCVNTTDDDGNSYLYQGYTTQSPTKYVCAGLNFSTFYSDGSNIDRIAVYAYDAAYALARGYHDMLYVSKLTNFTGDNLRDAIIYNVSFMGASGKVDFVSEGIGSDAFGVGDRESDLLYDVMNFDPNYLVSTTGPLRRIGFFSIENGFQLCNTLTDNICSAIIIYNTDDNSCPSDVLPIVEVQLEHSVQIGLQAAASICLVLVLIFFIILLLFRQHRLVKAAQPEMLYVVLLGAFLATIRVYIATVDITDTTCIIGKWLGHLSFGLVFGALILKTWKVNVVVNSGLRRVRVTVQDLQKVLMVGIGLLCAYLLLDTFVGQPHRDYDQSSSGKEITRLIKCTNKIQGVTQALFVIEFLLLVYGAQLCWATKNVPDAVNDSTYIAIGKLY